MVKDLLQATQLTHKQLADLLGISVRTLGLWKKDDNKINEPAKKLIRHCLGRYEIYVDQPINPSERLVRYIESL